MDELSALRKEVASLKQGHAFDEFKQNLSKIKVVNGINVLSIKLEEANADTLRQIVDRFRQLYPTQGIIVMGSVIDGRPVIIAAVTEDLFQRGFNAIDLIKSIAAPMGGGGGGRPTLAQAGGKDASKLEVGLASVEAWVKAKLEH
jgi:alanyl-tRNA synthetase